MPCKIKIRQNLRDTVERLSNPGLGMNIKNAKQLAGQINRRFGESVVTFSLQDVIERDINISAELVREYYEKEFQIELNESRQMLSKDASRASEEYTDRYLYGDGNIFDDEQSQVQRDKQIATKLSEKFSLAFGIPSAIVSRDQAVAILENSPTPLKPNASAFFFGDTVYFIEGKFNSSNVLHEFSHPFLKGIQFQNPKLFSNLYNQAITSEKGKLLLKTVTEKYPELDVNSDRFKEEVLATAIEISGNDYINEAIDNDYSFNKFIKNLIYAIKQVIKGLVGKNVRLSKLNTATTLDELVDMMVNKDFVIEDLEYLKSDYAEFKLETEQYLKDLEQADTKKFQEVIDTMHAEMQYQIRVLRNSPKKLKEELESEGGKKVLENIRDYVAPFKTKDGKLSQENLDEVLDGLEEQENDLRTRSIALINSIAEIETFSNKINNILVNLEKEKRHKSVDGIAKVQYFKKLLIAEKNFIDKTRLNLKNTNQSNPFINKLAAISQNIEDNLQLVSELSKDFTVQFFEENTETMSENIRKNFKNEITKRLKANDYTNDDIDLFLQDILNKIDNQGLKKIMASSYTLPKPPSDKLAKVLNESIKTYVAKKISRDTILNYLEGKTEDLSVISAMYTPLGNVDDLLGSVYNYTKNKLALSQTKSLNQVNAISNKLLPLFKAAGVNMADSNQVRDALLFIDKVASINSETNEVEEYEIYSIIDKFKTWRFDQDVLNNNLAIAQKSDDADAISKATNEINDFQEKYMNRPYKEEVYNIRKMWSQDNSVYNPATKSNITISKKVSMDAFVERQKSLQELNVLNTNEAWTDLEDLLEFSPSALAKIKYDELYNLVDINGKFKQGEELERVLIRRQYRTESKKFYEYSTDMKRFEDDYNHFINVVLAGEGITKDSNEELYNDRVSKFIEKNTKIAYTSEYYQNKSRILNDLRTLQAKSRNNPVIEKLNNLYEERFRIVNLVTDKDGEPKGKSLSSVQLERLKKIENDIVILNKEFDKKTGLSTSDSLRLKALTYKLSNKETLSKDEEIEFKSLSTRRNELGMTSVEITQMKKLYSELSEIRNVTPTDDYVDVFNNLLSGLNEESLTKFDIEDFVSDTPRLEAAFENSNGGDLFKDWFIKNHYLRDMWDGTKFAPGYVRLKVWSVERPSSKEYYKTSKIEDADGNTIEIQGIPVAKYSTSTIKDEYRTIPRGADRSKYVGTIIDNRGNFLPKEYTGTKNGAFDNKYQNEKFYEMKSKNDAKFKLLEGYKEEYLGVQKDSVYSSRMYLDLARFRQRTNYEAFTTGQTKDKLNARKEKITTSLEYVKSFIQGRKDDAEVGFNFEESTQYIPTDLEGNRITKVPVRGMYKLSLKETSTDAMRSMWDYMYSLNEQKTLIEDEPVMNAILEVMGDPENAIKDMNVASGNLGKINSRLNLITKNSSEDKRITALKTFVDRTFYAQKVSEFQQRYRKTTKGVNLVMGNAARAFFALNPQSSLKNRFGMQINKAIEVAGGKHIDLRSAARGKYRASIATWNMATVANYTQGAKSLDVQISDAIDMIPGRNSGASSSFGESSSRTLKTDLSEGKLLYADRKLMEQNSALELGFGMLYKQKVDQMQLDGTIKQIDYAEAWELDEEGVMKLKDGVDPEWSNVPIEHTVGEGNTLESLSKQYGITVENLMAKNKIKTNRNLQAGENLIISKSTKFNNFRLLVQDANSRLNGITDSIDTPLAEKYLMYRTFGFSRRFLTGMFINRFQMDLSENNKYGDVYNWNTNELTRGYYIDALSTMKKTLTDFSYISKYATDREKAALKKTLTEAMYIALLSMAVALIFGYAPDDPDRLKKIKNREKEWGKGGWLANQILYQLIMVRKENRLWFSPRDSFEMVKDVTISTGPTVVAYMKITNDLLRLATGNEKAYYSQDVGYYDWQKEGSAKLWNHLGSTIGLSGKNFSPYWAIKKNEQFENLR